MIRVDDAGMAWEPCPNCGLERTPSMRGIRAHDEFCNGALQRYMTILAERAMVPFQREPWVNPYTGRVDGRVLGETPRMRWRVSPDEWYRLEAWAKTRHGFAVASDLPAHLFGWPIDPDRTLPPGSIVLEAIEA